MLCNPQKKKRTHSQEADDAIIKKEPRTFVFKRGRHAVSAPSWLAWPPMQAPAAQQRPNFAYGRRSGITEEELAQLLQEE